MYIRFFLTFWFDDFTFWFDDFRSTSERGHTAYPQTRTDQADMVCIFDFFLHSGLMIFRPKNHLFAGRVFDEFISSPHRIQDVCRPRTGFRVRPTCLRADPAPGIASEGSWNVPGRRIERKTVKTMISFYREKSDLRTFLERSEMDVILRS